MAAAMIAATWVAMPAAAQGSPSEVELRGVVRDFSIAHPDFDVNPSGGNGHYAGNAALGLGPTGRPVLSGGGFRVDAQWRDSENRPIAPHLFGGWSAGALLVAGEPTIGMTTTLDTWDATVGPYGPGNVGGAPNVVEGAVMPEITAPTDMPASVGAAIYEGVGTSLLSGDLHCSSLTIKDGHTVQVSGSVRVLCDGNFDMRDVAAIELLAGASIELYVLGDISIQDSTINDGFYEPGRFVLYHLGTGQVRISDGASVYGTIISPQGTLVMPDASDFYGVVIAADVVLADAAGVHIAASSPYDQCGGAINDLEGLAGPASSGGITSATTFSEWFRDVLGVNQSMSHALTLVRNGDGVYEYLDSSFYPIDGRLLGNEGQDHNYYFTFTLDCEFTYDACSDQFLSFQGGDGTWIYIDGELAIDLGGVLPAVEQVVDLDRLGLVDGQTYQLKLFTSNRDPAGSVFNLRTNVELMSNELPMLLALFD